MHKVWKDWGKNIPIHTPAQFTTNLDTDFTPERVRFSQFFTQLVLLVQRRFLGLSQCYILPYYYDYEFNYLINR